MSELKQERKRLKTVRRVLKWLGVGLLAILLILTLIFQAPWKINLLLAVFLAACTVLPKPLRKWFWLSVGAVVLGLIIWVFLPEDNDGWRPYTFDAELAALEAKYAIPDEENAALLYDEIFESLDVDVNQPEFFLKSKPSSINKPWLSKDHPKTAEWLRDHQGLIAHLLQATQKDNCYFPMPPSIWDIGQHAKLAPMRKCAFLLASAGNNDIAEGRIDAGLEIYLCIVRMADHLYQQPVTIDFMVASAIESLALIQLNRFLIESRPTAEQLKLVADSAGDLKNDWGSEIKKILESDRLFFKNSFFSMVYEVNLQGRTRFSRNPHVVFKAILPKELPELTYPQRLLCKVKALLAWLGMPPTPQKAAEIFDACFDKHYAMAEPGFDWAKRQKEFDSLFTKSNLTHIRLNLTYVVRLLVDASQRAYFSLHDTYLQSLTMRRGSRVLVALRQYHKQYGAWPDTLDAIKSTAPPEALIDPVTGKPLEYENQGERFSLHGESVKIWPK